MDDLTIRRKRKDVDEGDEALFTPKKARISHATRHATRETNTSGLSPHLARLLNIHTALEQPMSLALATGQIAPDPDNGRVPAVLNHLGIAEHGMGRMRMDVNDLRRLCWVWEWDRDVEHETPSSREVGPILSQRTTRPRVHSDTSMRSVKTANVGDENDNFSLDKPMHSKVGAQIDNPFDHAPESETPKDWVRGGSGFIITSTMHVRKNAVTGTLERVPAYGIGIEVDWAHEDVAGGRVGGMRAVERWAAAGETRNRTFKEKLERWVEVHSSPASRLPTPAPSAMKSKIVGVTPLDPDSSIPVIPFADLPALYNPPSHTGCFPSVTLSSVKATSSNKHDPSPFKKDDEGFVIPVAPGSQTVTPSGNHTPSTSFLLRSGGIRTLSFGRAAAAKAVAETTPSSRKEGVASRGGRATPTLSLKKPIDLILKTPTHQRGNNSEPTSVSGANSKSTPNTGAAEPETPPSARRLALEERVRTKSESEGSDKKPVAVTASVRKSRSDATKFRSARITPEELRRRRILDSLGSVAEAIWMLFASPANGRLKSAGRKRRAILQEEVVRAAIKSADSPISDADVVESIKMLCELCPIFFQRKVIKGKDWLEMPATTSAAPMSPGASVGGSTRPRYTGGLQGVMGSPGKVREEGGLGRVKEIIKRKRESDDYC